MDDGVWKGAKPAVLGRSHQLFLNKMFDQSTSSMKNVHNGENGGEKVQEKNKSKMKKMDEL